MSENPVDDPLTGRCARCGAWFSEHPGGFCPDVVDLNGTVLVGNAPEFVPGGRKEKK